MLTRDSSGKIKRTCLFNKSHGILCSRTNSSRQKISLHVRTRIWLHLDMFDREAWHDSVVLWCLFVDTNWFGRIQLYNESFTCGKIILDRKTNLPADAILNRRQNSLVQKILWSFGCWIFFKTWNAYTFDSKLDDLSDNFASNIPCGLWDETRISQRMSELKPSSTFSQSIHTHRKESLGCLRSLHLKSQGSQSLQKSCNFSKPWRHTDVEGSRIKLRQTRCYKSGRNRLCMP